MSKNKIVTSNDFFKEYGGTLSRRQPSGGATKSQAEQMNNASRRLIAHKDGFTLGGIVGGSARRGSEVVNDNIVLRDSIYCMHCGTSNVGSAAECKLCFNTAFSKSKYEIDCGACLKPFHTKSKRPAPPSESKAVFPMRVKSTKILAGGKLSKQTDADIALAEYNAQLDKFEQLTCKCFAERKAARRREMSIKSQVARQAKNADIVECRKISDARRRLAELETIDKSRLSRADKDILFKEKCRLYKIVNHLDGLPVIKQ